MASRLESVEDGSLSALYEALDTLRRADDAFSPRLDAVWRVVSAWVRDRTPRHETRRDDITQETLLAIARSVQQMDATTPRQAAKWTSVIMRRKHIDLLRGDAHDAVAHGLVEDEFVVETVPTPEVSASSELLDAQHRRIEERVLAFVDASERSASVRLTRRAMARASLYRLVLELEPDAVEARLGLPEPVGRDRLYKWVERGRTVLAEAMRDWAQALPDEADVQAISQVVIELAEARRADAGKPRPERRRP